MLFDEALVEVEFKNMNLTTDLDFTLIMSYN